MTSPIEIFFEVQPNVEIWRTKEATFTVLYPSSTLVCVKGLRGKITRKELKALSNIFYSKGYKEILFERLVNNQLIQRTKPLKHYPGIKGKTYKREI